MVTAIYPRVSTQEQATEGYSIDEQIKRLKKYCEAHEWDNVKIYTDAGFSGGSIERPALQELIKDVQDGKVERVVVYKLDRLSRSQKDTLHLIEDIFMANNCDFVSMNEKFDTGTSFGRAMIGILAVFAQLEREQIKERMTMGKEGRAKKGLYHGGGHIPVGYEYIDGKLIINDYEAMQIRMIHELYQQGKSRRQIEIFMREKGYRHKYGNWTNARIRDVMINELYIGYVHFNGQSYKGEHEPIVDEETYKKSKQIHENRFQNKPKSCSHASYLGGVLFCKQCSARYSQYTTVQKGKTYSYYTCYSRRKVSPHMIKDPNCKNKNYNQQTLDEMVLNEIRKLKTDPNYIATIQEESYSESEREKENLILKQIEKLDAQKSRFMDLYGLGEFTIDEVQEKVAPLNEEKAKLQEDLKALTEEKTTMTQDEVLEVISDFEGIIERGNIEEVRMMIESLIDRIEIDGDDIFIHWRFA